MAANVVLGRVRSVLSPLLRRRHDLEAGGLYGYIVAPDQLCLGMKVLNSDGGARHGMLDPLSQVGNSMPLSAMRIGAFVHCVDHRPGEGACFVRAAGASAKILRLGDDGLCVLRMPSGVEKTFDSRCRATIGRVSNPERKYLKLRKAGQARCLAAGQSSGASPPPWGRGGQGRWGHLPQVLEVPLGEAR